MRGAVLLQAGARSVELRLTTNRLCWLEDVTGKAVGDIFKALSGEMKMNDLRLLLQAAAGLPDDPQAAGDIIDDAGINAVAEALGKAAEAAFPQAGADEKKKLTAA